MTSSTRSSSTPGAYRRLLATAAQTGARKGEVLGLTWGDVDTQQGPCTQFDGVKVTLPDNFTPARIASSGCVDPGLVSVGPLSSGKPS